MSQLQPPHFNPDEGAVRAPAYTSLYRRWRPQLFSQVVGQDHVRRTLQNALERGRVAHAYLFCGLRGTGKTTMAKLLAKALNCEEGVGAEPCNACRSCREISAGRNLDVLEIDAASNRGIDEIRELRERVRYTAAENRYKVYIIDEVHMLTNEAFNALLKTLEEPPAGVVFVLATTEAHKLPLTVISRCQRFEFHLLEPEQIADRLREVAGDMGFEVEEEALYLLARQAEGSARDALGFMEQCLAYGGEQITHGEALEVLGLASPRVIYDLLQAVVEENTAAGLAAVREVVSKGRDLHRFIRELILYLRKLLLLQAGENEEAVLSDVPSLRPYLKEHRSTFDRFVLLEMLEILQELVTSMKGAAHPQFLLELSFLRISRAYSFRRYLSPRGLLQALEELEEKLQSEGMPGLASLRAAGEGQERAAPLADEPAPSPKEEGRSETKEAAGEAEGKSKRLEEEKEQEKEPEEQPEEQIEEHALGNASPEESVSVTPSPPPPPLAEEEEAPPVFPPEEGSQDAGGEAPSASPEAGALEEEPASFAEGAEELAGASPGQEVPGEPGTPIPDSNGEASRGEAPAESPADLDAFWQQEFLPALKKKRKPGMHAILQEGRPLSLEGGVLTIAFPTGYSFHKEQVEALKNRKVIEAIMKELLGRSAVLKAVFREEEAAAEDPLPGFEAEAEVEEEGEEQGGGGEIFSSPPAEGSPSNPPPQKGKQKGGENEFYIREMLDLFKGRLIDTGGQGWNR